MSAPPPSLAYGALITAAVVWGGSIVAQKVALGPFSAVEVSVFRGTGALCILIPLWWFQEGGLVKWSARDAGIFAALGLGVLGNHLLVLYGLEFIEAGAAGIIIGASPVITALLSALFLKEATTAMLWLGCALSFLGVGLVSGGGASQQTGEHPLFGGVLIVLGLVSWALYTVGSRTVMERFSPLTVNWTTLLISILFQIPLLATDYKVLETGMAGIPVSGWLALGYVIVFATAVGQQAWLYGVSRVGAARAGVFVNLIPVSALLLSAVILSESIGAREIGGIVLILLGVWMVNRPPGT